MNHRKFGIKLGRNRRERAALFRSLTTSVFTHGAIETTQAKAKSVVSIIEKLANWIITKDAIIAQRELSKYIQNKKLVSQIYTSFKNAFGEQTSNFTKMWKIKLRQGDDALIVKLTFTKPYTLTVPASDKKAATPAIQEPTVKKPSTAKKVAKK